MLICAAVAKARTSATETAAELPRPTACGRSPVISTSTPVR